MSDELVRIYRAVKDPSLADDAKLEAVMAILAEPFPMSLILGIVERLVAALKSEAGFGYVNPNLTSRRCLTVAEPLLDGARLEENLVGCRTLVLAELGRRGRRAATVAEGLLYGLKHPEALTVSSRIWVLGQIVMLGTEEHVLLFGLGGDGRKRCASLMHTSHIVFHEDRVLCFPMKEAELVDRDAEGTEGSNA